MSWICISHSRDIPRSHFCNGRTLAIINTHKKREIKIMETYNHKDKEYKVDGVWLIDENGNKNSSEYHGSVEAAAMALYSLKDCNQCVNCSGCSDCSRCYGCYNCSDCSRCYGCSDCSDCSDCSRCYDCCDCSDCSDCSRCYGCSDCSDCPFAVLIICPRALSCQLLVLMTL